MQVAAATGAYRTILTHFSQRYPKMPAGLSPDGASGHAPNALCKSSEDIHHAGFADGVITSVPTLQHAGRFLRTFCDACTACAVLRAAPGADRMMIAFDGMRVPLALLPQLPRLMPAVMAALETNDAPACGEAGDEQ